MVLNNSSTDPFGITGVCVISVGNFALALSGSLIISLYIRAIKNSNFGGRFSSESLMPNALVFFPSH